MRTQSLEFLQRLLTTPSPSGFERAGQRVWLDYAKRWADETHTDTYGTAVAAIQPGASPRVAIVGHADEIGLMVRHVDKRGFLYVAPIGGVDPAVLPGKRLTIHTARGPVRGVTGATAIHLSDRDGDPKPRKLHEIFVDIGADSEKAALRRVQIGDPITFVDDFEVLDGDTAVSRALDNRIGTWVAAETLRLIRESKRRLRCAVFGVSAVQEEIGLRGSHMITVTLRPDVALVVDVGHATDSPGIDHRRHGLTKLGRGPILSIGGGALPEVTAHLEKVAKAQRIPLQRRATPGASSTDMDSVFKVSGGVASALVSLPIRYMHTTVEMTSLRDLERIAQLFAAFCLSLGAGQRFQAQV
ncbi:MAG: M42 family metallopeptidase [Candidatus Sumerlaeia bacterium]|nr:M42 family metallopeptidase [Candidatus Sumerlaeia bacterium]